MQAENDDVILNMITENAAFREKKEKAVEVFTPRPSFSLFFSRDRLIDIFFIWQYRAMFLSICFPAYRLA
jgi:hypothetical protein